MSHLDVFMPHQTYKRTNETKEKDVYDELLKKRTDILKSYSKKELEHEK